MLYLGTPSSPTVREAMTAGLIGCMTTPAQGNRIPGGALWAADNGKFGRSWRGPGPWYAWLARKVDRYGPERCLWALAPDVPFDAAGTLAESRPWLSAIRRLGVPAAFAVQDGCELDERLIPWGEFDVVFLAGTTGWKLGHAAADIALHALGLGKPVHMGRVSSQERMNHAKAIGCRTADGTYLRFRDANEGVREVIEWCRDDPKRQPPHVQFPLPLEVS